MGTNMALCRAKAGRDDEFYTQMKDVENEIRLFAAAFRGKRVFCGFDTEDSAFVRYLDANFETLGLAALKSAGWREEGGEPVLGVYLRDCCGSRHIGDTSENSVRYGFFSETGQTLLDDSDILVTNPPFSRFRDILSLLLEKNKQFLLIGSTSMLTEDVVFRAVTEGRAWLGSYRPQYYLRPDGSTMRIGSGCWFTNLLPESASQTAASRFLAEKYDPGRYLRYANFDGIDVPRVRDIPVDYFGVMGVPAGFLETFGPTEGEDDGRTDGLHGHLGRWFEILGLAPACLDKGVTFGQAFLDEYRAIGGTAKISAGMKGLALYDKNNKPVLPYRRILIRRRYGQNGGTV